MRQTTAPNSAANLYVDEIPGSVLGTSLIADDRNITQEELVNAVLSGEIALDGTGVDQAQLAKAIANLASKGDFYVETGGSAADVYVVERTGDQEQITEYKLGMRIRFIPGDSNTMASTLAVGVLPAELIKYEDGSGTQANDLRSGEIIELYYDGTDFIIANNSIKSGFIDKISYSVDDEQAISDVSQTALGQLVLKEGVSKVWPKELLKDGKIFIRFFMTNGGAATSTATVQLHNGAIPNIIWERTVLVDNPANNEMNEYVFDLSTGNTVDLDLSAVDMAGINSLSGRSAISAQLSIAGSTIMRNVEFLWRR